MVGTARKAQPSLIVTQWVPVRDIRSTTLVAACKAQTIGFLEAENVRKKPNLSMFEGTHKKKAIVTIRVNIRRQRAVLLAYEKSIYCTISSNEAHCVDGM